MTNPLLDMLQAGTQSGQSVLPPFAHIEPKHVEPAIDQILQDNKKTLDNLLQQSSYSWDNFVQPLEEMSDRLQRVWSPVSHMNSVVNSDELREAYNICLPKLSEYSTELGQNEKLYQAYQSIADDKSFSELDIAQQKIINNALRDFHLSGVDLEQEKKQRFKEIKQRLSKLKTQFEENILDATHAWHKQIKDEKNLEEITESLNIQIQKVIPAQRRKIWLVRVVSIIILLMTIGAYFYIYKDNPNFKFLSQFIRN